MRKFLLVLLSILLFFSLQAQDSLKYQKFYPQKGDWGVSVDLLPLIGLFDNVVHWASTNNSYTPLGLKINSTILHMISDNKARMYSIDIFGVHKTVLAPVKIYTGTMPTPLSSYYNDNDRFTVDYYRLKLGIGTQWRKSKKRFQTYWGYLINIGYTYGGHEVLNPALDYSTINDETFVSVHNFSVSYSDNSVSISSNYQLTNLGSRLLSRKNGDRLLLGTTGLIGVDFFVLPKLAIGSNVSFSISGSYTMPGSETYEYFNFSNPDNISYYRKTEKIPGLFGLNFGLDLGSVLYMRIFL